MAQRAYLWECCWNFLKVLTRNHCSSMQCALRPAHAQFYSYHHKNEASDAYITLGGKMNRTYSVGEVARQLNLKPYRIVYAIATGQLPEPTFRFLGKRCFTTSDIQAIATHFGKIVQEEPCSGDTII